MNKLYAESIKTKNSLLNFSFLIKQVKSLSFSKFCAPRQLVFNVVEFYSVLSQCKCCTSTSELATLTVDCWRHLIHKTNHHVATPRRWNHSSKFTRGVLKIATGAGRQGTPSLYANFHHCHQRICSSSPRSVSR